MEKIPIIQKNTLRSLRVKFGYTQDEAAKLLNISVPTLRSWETDSGRIPFMKMPLIEKIYKTSSDYIFFGNELAFCKLIREQDQHVS